jgi:hypothetical protein
MPAAGSSRSAGSWRADPVGARQTSVMAAKHDLAELAGLPARPDIRLIATDMDGTLLNDEKEIHEEFWPLIEELRTRGITFCPASGRQYQGLLREFAPVADDLVYIAENGTFVVGPKGVEISSDCMDLDVAHEVCRVARGVDHTGTVLCGKRSAYVESEWLDFREEVDLYYPRLQVVSDLTAVADDEVLKVAIWDATVAEDNTFPALAQFRDGFQVVVSGQHWVDVMSATANKGDAIRQVQRALGVGPDQTMVFGDFLNDLEMMDAATYSFAMSNAHSALAERATWTAPSNNANGVVRTIRTLLGLAEYP